MNAVHTCYETSDLIIQSMALKLVGISRFKSQSHFKSIALQIELQKVSVL